MMKGYADLFHLHEDARIEIIGKRAATGERVGFVVEDNVKADRYVKKLSRLFPDVEVVKRSDGPVKDTVFVIVTRRVDA